MHVLLFPSTQVLPYDLATLGNFEAPLSHIVEESLCFEESLGFDTNKRG
jgi:hypothetical protein